MDLQYLFHLSRRLMLYMKLHDTVHFLSQCHYSYAQRDSSVNCLKFFFFFFKLQLSEFELD